MFKVTSELFCYAQTILKELSEFTIWFYSDTKYRDCFCIYATLGCASSVTYKVMTSIATEFPAEFASQRLLAEVYLPIDF